MKSEETRRSTWNPFSFRRDLYLIQFQRMICTPVFLEVSFHTFLRYFGFRETNVTLLSKIEDPLCRFLYQPITIGFTTWLYAVHFLSHNANRRKSVLFKWITFTIWYFYKWYPAFNVIQLTRNFFMLKLQFRHVHVIVQTCFLELVLEFLALHLITHLW